MTIGNDKELEHQPVMIGEVLRELEPLAGKRIIDATFGAGGYSRGFIRKGAGEIYGIDRDPLARQYFTRLIAEFVDGGDGDITVNNRLEENSKAKLQNLANGSKIALVSSDFGNMQSGLHKEYGVDRADYIVFDLGVSSMQLDDGSRGFSFTNNGPINMRMDGKRFDDEDCEYSQNSTESAFCARRSQRIQLKSYNSSTVKGTPDEELVEELADDNRRDVNILLENASIEELTKIIRDYGEEPHAKLIAQHIVKAREQDKLPRTTIQLANLVKWAVPYGRSKRQKKHPATKMFQALRIWVNDELGQLEKGLEIAKTMIEKNNGGKIAVVSFHSLEDRIVKNYFADLSGKKSDSVNRHMPYNWREEVKIDDDKAAGGGKGKWRAKKMIKVSDEEAKQNPRARSAKLRVAEYLV